MTVLITGGVGFVGLNIAEAFLREGRSVILLDRLELPEEAAAAFADLPGRLETAVGDATDPAIWSGLITPALDAIVMGATITASAEREARDPETILRVNLLSQIPLLEQARSVGVRRVVNLSSVAAYGAAAEGVASIPETRAADPATLYGITKFASERVGARLAELWGLDVLSVRLSGVFGPWERATGVRDTISPQTQLLSLATTGRPALLDRPGMRDWLYARDAAAAVLRLVAADRVAHRLYNVSGREAWPVLDWGRRLMPSFPGFECRLVRPGEAPTVSLHTAVDRAPLDTSRLSAELGWSARFGMEEAADDYVAWWLRHGSRLGTPE